MRTWMVLVALLVVGQALPQSVFDQGITLNGNGEYVEVLDEPQLNFQGPFTVEVRVYSEQYNEGNWQEFVFKGGNNAPAGEPRQYFIRPRQSTGLVEFVVHDEDDNVKSVRSSLPLANGVCYHLAGVFDGSNMRLYVDGYLVDEDNTGPLLLSQSMQPLTFGRLGSVDAEYLDGSLDEVRIWDHARTHAQVLATIEDTLSSAYYATADSGLVGYWRLDESGGKLALDLSVYGNHGTRIGGQADPACQINVAIEEVVDATSTSFITMIQPNPVLENATVMLHLPQDMSLIVELLDVQGRLVRTVAQGHRPAGEQILVLDAAGLDPGQYLLQVRAGSERSVARVSISH